MKPTTQSDSVRRASVSDAWRASLERGVDLLSERRWNEAQVAISESLVNAPNYELPDLYALRAYARLQSQDAQGAADDATACLGLHPHQSEALWWRGIAECLTGKWDEAISDVARSIELSDDHQRSKREWLSTAVDKANAQWKLDARSATPDAHKFARRAHWYLALGDTSRARRDINEALRMEPDHTHALLAGAELEHQLGNLVEALKWINRAIEQGPTRSASYRLRALLNFKSGHRCKALSDAEMLEQLSSGQLADRLDLAWFRSRLGDHLRALEQVDECRHRYPDNLEVLASRGRLLSELRCWRLASEQWEELTRLRPRQVDYLIEQGRCNLKMKRLDQARACFERAAQLAPTSPDTHLGIAQTYWQSRQAELAQEALQRALRLETTHLPSQVLQGHLQVAAGQTAEASATLEAAWGKLRAGGESLREWAAECAYTLGVICLELGELPRAVEWFDQSLRLRPEHAGTLVWRAKAWARQGKMDLCQQDLFRARRLNPSCDSAYQRLAEELAEDFLTTHRVLPHSPENRQHKADVLQTIIAWEMVGQVEKAQREYRNTVPDDFDNDPRVGWEWTLAGYRLKVIGDEAPVLEILQNVIEDDLSAKQVLALADILGANQWTESHLHWLQREAERVPDNGPLAHWVGKACHQLRHHKAAIRWLSRALALGHVEAETLALRGASYLARGRAAEARSDLTIALERHPNQPDWLTLRGESYLKDEHYDEALQDFELALTIDSRQVKAYCGRAMVLARRGAWEPALLWITKAIHRFKDPHDWAGLISCRGKIFFNMKRFRRAVSDWEWALRWTRDSRDQANWYFSRAMAWFHLEDMERMHQDLERCLILNPKHRAAQSVQDWLDNRSEAFPSQLAPPRKKIQPTRPPVAGDGWEVPKAVRAEPEFPLNQWIVRCENGTEYGPVERDTLLQWCSEGRVRPKTWLLRSDWDRWRRADVALKQLARKTTTSKTDEAEEIIHRQREMPGPYSMDDSQMASTDSGTVESPNE